jgi:hypothetical protein
MLFSEVNLAARRLLSAAALLSLGLPAVAQQAIQFTKPVDHDATSKANAFLPEKANKNPANFNAPSPLFGSRSPSVSFDVLPGSPQPMISGANAAQWRKSQNDKKNWALMTPEEILGIPTPEKILGIPDTSDDPKLSDAERYLQRQRRQTDIGVSNALHHADASLWRNNGWNSESFQTADGGAKFAGTLDGSVPGATRNLGDLFRQRPDDMADVNGGMESAWKSPFQAPAPLPKPTPEQLAGMDRFRALLEPPAQVKTPQASQPVIAPDPNIQQMPVFNPAGQSFTRLANDTAKPVGLTPLPGVTGPHQAPAKKQTPLVQPPPWMQSSLDSGVMPQRQF